MARILVVEDDAIQAEQLQSLLKSEGFNVDVCFETKAALALFSEDKHDLAICNIVTPPVSGYDFCRRIKARSPDKRVPVILFANHGDPIDIAQGLMCEAEHFITKPYKSEQLVSRIRSVLKGPETQGAPTSDEVSFLGRAFATGSQKARLLDLLIAAFEDHVQTREILEQCRAELAETKQAAATLTKELEHRVRERVAEQGERQENLYQSQKMDSLGELSSGLAHDFNNMLTVVVGNLDTIAAEIRGDPRITKLSNTALEAALRGAELTRQLLVFSRKQPLAPRLSNLNELVSSRVQMLGPIFGENVQLDIDEDPDLWPTLVDPAQFQMAISNLAKNAVEAMPNGGKLRIETHNVVLDSRFASTNLGVTPGEHCLIVVSDTGCGISPEAMPRVFEPLFTSKAGQRSAGLGLSMVFGFTRQSGGQILIDSEVGKGTSVRIYLPRAKGDAAVQTLRTAAQTDRPLSGDETILVVEDEPTVRYTVIQQLRQLGYRVLEADRAARALEILDHNQTIDLLFTDIIMPGGMSGRDLGRKAALLRPSLKVLYTSGYMRGIRDDHKLDPTDIFIGKPFRLRDLAQKVREALGHELPKSAAAG